MNIHVPRLKPLAPSPAMLTGLAMQPVDALLALIAQFRDDPRPEKIDVGVGVYRDADGATPVLKCVKEAEFRLWSGQRTKAYIGTEGDAAFIRALAPIVLGDAHAPKRTWGIQTSGGAGALRLAAELLAKANPQATVWMGAPTWPNHAPIFRAAGLNVRKHPYFDAATRDVDFGAMMTALGGMTPGDVLLLHGCCHNPTGADLAPDQWQDVAELCLRQGVVPLVDLAYQGLGTGLEEDALGLHLLLRALPEVLVAYSCDKNFGVYRDRVGALWVQSARRADVEAVRSNLTALARSIWSMPPDHGAATVRIVLEDEALRTLWQEELTAMRERTASIRHELAKAHPLLAPLGRQNGMFALLPIAKEQVAMLRERHAIYMPDSGRINLAGLNETQLPEFIAAVLPCLQQEEGLAS